jgi:hypothetical protein
VVRLTSVSSAWKPVENWQLKLEVGSWKSVPLGSSQLKSGASVWGWREMVITL